MKSKVSTKMSDDNIEFWKRLNLNLIKSNILEEFISYSDLQEYLIKYFKSNNVIYIEMLEFIRKTKGAKNGSN